MMDALKSRPALSIAGLASLSTLILLELYRARHEANPSIVPSPRETLLPSLSPTARALLPYPPDALSGNRDVPTPYGTIKVFEFGPPSQDGESEHCVLLLPGISTPCIALSNLASALVATGNCRVILFDYYGRGWSDTPDPEHVHHDERLYMAQIFHVLSSSPQTRRWLSKEEEEEEEEEGGGGRERRGFHIMGYSFGGGLAVSFASCHPHLVRSVTLIAPGGLMPWSGNSWRTRMLYFTPRWILPEWVQRYYVRKRFEPVAKLPPSSSSSSSFSPSSSSSSSSSSCNNKDHDDDVAAVLVEQAENGSDPWDDAVVATRERNGVKVNITVADVMTWQLQHHEGFVPAVTSSFRYGPIHERYEEWGRLGGLLAARRHQRPRRQIRRDGVREKQADLLGLLGGKVLLVLGKSDPIVREKRLVPEMKKVLGDEAVEVVVLDAGHEVAITKGPEIVAAWAKFIN